MYTELFTACILGFFYLLRISELENLKWGDMSVGIKDGKRYLSIKIKQSKTDVFRDGVVRSLVEVDSVLCPVKTFLEWKEMSYDTNNEKGNVFGINLRARVSAVMKTAALANGVFGQRIDTHSLRAGGATALYTQGVPLDVIQRWGRWKSLTFHQYLWHDATALRHLSEVMVQSSGLIDCLRLMNKTVPKVRFQDTSTMEGKPVTEGDPVSLPTSLFLPNERYTAGGRKGANMDESDATAFSPSDLPPYTASPTDVMHGTRMLTKREKQEKQEKKEDSDNTDRDTTKVELFSGEESVSSRSSSGSPSFVSRTACPYANFDTDQSDSSGATVPDDPKRSLHDSSNRKSQRGKKERNRKDRREKAVRKKEVRCTCRSRSGGRRTSWADKDKKEPKRGVRRRAASDSPVRRRRRREDKRTRGRTPKRRCSRNRRVLSLRKDRERRPARIFSTSNESEGDKSVSSSGLPRVFLSNEYLESETSVWINRAKEGEAVVREFSAASSNDRPESVPHVLNNRVCKLITRESLLNRNTSHKEQGPKLRISSDLSDYPSGPEKKGADNVGKRSKEPFQRFRPTNKGTPPSRTRSLDEIATQEPASASEPPTGQSKRKFVTSMPPPTMPSRISIHSGTSKESGVKASGQIPSGASASGNISDRRSGFHDPASLALPKRRRQPRLMANDNAEGTGSECIKEHVDVQVYSPASSGQSGVRKRNLAMSDIRAVNSAAASSDQQALKDAEAMWHMFTNPVYGDPTCPEEEFSELSVRFAKKGHKWVRLAMAHGVTMANRRIRSENRAFHGYGLNKPANTPPPFHEQFDEYDSAKKLYLGELMRLIQAHEGKM